VGMQEIAEPATQEWIRRAVGDALPDALIRPRNRYGAASTSRPQFRPSASIHCSAGTTQGID
jgi:hypothetical protein